MNPETFVAFLGASGVGAVIASIVAGLFSRRKLGAEATEVITRAAAGVVTNLHTEIERQGRINETLVHDHRRALKACMDAHKAEMSEVHRVLQEHVAWDAIVVAKMAELGIQLPPAPPIMPPVQDWRPESGVDWSA